MIFICQLDLSKAFFKKEEEKKQKKKERKEEKDVKREGRNRRPGVLYNRSSSEHSLGKPWELATKIIFIHCFHFNE